jgi:hypothetical protein
VFASKGRADIGDIRKVVDKATVKYKKIMFVWALFEIHSTI